MVIFLVLIAHTNSPINRGRECWTDPYLCRVRASIFFSIPISTPPHISIEALVPLFLNPETPTIACNRWALSPSPPQKNDTWEQHTKNPYTKKREKKSERMRISSFFFTTHQKLKKEVTKIEILQIFAKIRNDEIFFKVVIFGYISHWKCRFSPHPTGIHGVEWALVGFRSN